MGGDDGIGSPEVLGLVAEHDDGGGWWEFSETESLRLGLGGGWFGGGEGAERGGRGRAGGGSKTSGKEGSGYCTTKSLNGPQK